MQGCWKSFRVGVDEKRANSVILNVAQQRQKQSSQFNITLFNYSAFILLQYFFIAYL